MDRFIEVTTTSGEQLYINPSYVVELKRCANTANKTTKITMSTHANEMVVYVKESPYQLASQLAGKYRPEPRPKP